VSEFVGGERVAGRVGERVSEFVGGMRRAASGLLAAFRRPLTLPLPLPLAASRWTGIFRRALLTSKKLDVVEPDVVNLSTGDGPIHGDQLAGRQRRRTRITPAGWLLELGE